MPVVLELEARGVARRNEAGDDSRSVPSVLAGRLEKEVVDCDALGAKYFASVDQPSAFNRTRLRARPQRDDRVVGFRAGAAADEALGRDCAQLLLDVRRFELAIQIDQQ